jgi:hypothetical protein
VFRQASAAAIGRAGSGGGEFELARGVGVHGILLSSMNVDVLSHGISMAVNID